MEFAPEFANFGRNRSDIGQCRPTNVEFGNAQKSRPQARLERRPRKIGVGAVPRHDPPRRETSQPPPPSNSGRLQQHARSQTAIGIQVTGKLKPTPTDDRQRRRHQILTTRVSHPQRGLLSRPAGSSAAPSPPSRPPPRPFARPRRRRGPGRWPRGCPPAGATGVWEARLSRCKRQIVAATRGKRRWVRSGMFVLFSARASHDGGGQ